MDLICVRETHQAHQADALVVSMRGGAILACPSGESLGHLWLAADDATLDDPRLAQEIVGLGRPWLELRARN